MSYVVTESKGIRITLIDKGDNKNYYLCTALGLDVEEKLRLWSDVIKFIHRYEKGERV